MNLVIYQLLKVNSTIIQILHYLGMGWDWDWDGVGMGWGFGWGWDLDGEMDRGIVHHERRHRRHPPKNEGGGLKLVKNTKNGPKVVILGFFT